MLDDAELVARAEANFRERSRLQFSVLDGGELREQDGVAVAASGIPVADLNHAFLTRPLSRPEAAIRGIIDYFDGRGLPFVIRLRGGLDPGSERVAAAMGFEPLYPMPVMVLYPLDIVDGSPDVLEIRRVEDQHTLRQFADVVWPEMGRRLWPPAALGLRDVVYYVGYVDGRPVATSCLVMTHQDAGVYALATLDEFRRRGFGEAMIRQVLRAGVAAGCILASIQPASELSRPLYERMGFRRVSDCLTFARPAAEHREA